MIQKKTFLFLNSIRVLYQGENISDLKEKADYLTIVSYKPLNLEGFELVHKKIANIYLDRSSEEIFNSFSVSTRNEIHKTERMSELEFKVPDNNFAETYRIYSEFEKLQGRKPWGKETFSGVLEFSAYYKDGMIVSIPCYDLKPYLQVRNISSKRLGAKDKDLYKVMSNASRRLIWEICKYAKENGYTFVGLGAVTETTEQKANVAKWKMFFNPRVEDEYTYTYKSARFKFLDRFRKYI